MEKSILSKLTWEVISIILNTMTVQLRKIKLKPVNNNLKPMTTLKPELGKYEDRARLFYSSMQWEDETQQLSWWHLGWAGIRGNSYTAMAMPKNNNLHFQSAFLSYREPFMLGDSL